MNKTVSIQFTNVQWPTLSLPTSFSKDVRTEFLYDNDGKLFNHDDLKDILKSWLHDEFNACPIDLDFAIEL